MFLNTRKKWRAVILSLTTGFVAYPCFAQYGDTYEFSHQINAMAEKDTNSWIYDLMATKYSFISDYKKSISAYDLSGDVNEPDTTGINIATCRIIDAKQYIVQRSKLEKVIMINEAHHQPLHRAFTASLLPGLWENGYRFLGLEAIADGDALMNRKKLEISDGFYTAEPEFAKMIRLALKLGFTIFSYEAGGKKGTLREQAQAENILKLVQTHPEDKFLIHCGFSHVTEDNHPDWGKAMAGRFRDLSGIDPFTIDQVEMTERGESKFEADTFKKLNVANASVVVDGSGLPCKVSDDSRQIDMKVIHARTSYAQGRPTWVKQDSTYKSIEIQYYFKTVTFPSLAFAYTDGEDDSYVPADVVEIKSASEFKPLLVPPGAYRLKVINEKGKASIKKIVIP